MGEVYAAARRRFAGPWALLKAAGTGMDAMPRIFLCSSWLAARGACKLDQVICFAFALNLAKVQFKFQGHSCPLIHSCKILSQD